MIILALDTCLGACGVAVVDGDRTLAVACETMTRGHQERLAPMARGVMASANVPFSRINRIGVTVGPGSFTGLRVGLAFAKGLALALDVACIGVGSLVALAASAKAAGSCVAVIDAGRGNVYLQSFEGGRAHGAPDILALELVAARLLKTDDLANLTLVGPSDALLAAICPTARHVVLAAPSPDLIGRLAARAPVTPPQPLYLRPPDATPKRVAAA